MRHYLLAGIVAAIALTAQGEFADYRFIPPAKTAAAHQEAGGVADRALARMARGAFPHYAIDDYAGQNSRLKHSRVHPALQVATGANLGWDAEQVFETPAVENGRYVWRAAIGSVDATALRLHVDLAGLRPDEVVWVVDTAGAYAFGPYTLADASGEGRWLPTTQGDTAVLVLSSPQPTLPRIRVEKLSHFYEELFSKGSDCPISADCIDDTSLQEISTGIGRMSVTDENGNSALCSGALLNNSMTTALEPLFLTADHCFQDFPATVLAGGVEVIWDVRTNGCPGFEPSTQEIARLPRSNGTYFLANSTELDAMLLALGSVPVGDRGRAYLGWDTRAPRIGNRAVSLHHPRGRALKESIGRVDDVGVNTSFGDSQVTLRWSEGITEGGSSGSPVLFDDGNFRTFGMLSNGNLQSCSNNNARLDQYSSFQSFFFSIDQFLASSNPVTTGRTTYRATGNGGNPGACNFGPQTFQQSAGDIALAGLSLLVMLGLGAVPRSRP